MSDSSSGSGLGQRIAAGAGWTITLRLTMRLLGVLSMIILARLLVPADFGLIALATIIAGALELLTALNLQVWLIRHPAPERGHYDTVWTMSIIRGAVTGLVLVALAYPVAAFFNEHRLSGVMQILAAASVIGGFKNVGVVDFLKFLQFDKDFRFLLGARLGAFVVTIGLAFWLRDYRALVGGLVAHPLLVLALSYKMHPYRPRLSLVYWREGFDFSKWLLVGDITAFVYDRSDNVILGKLVSTSSLGLYTLAHEIASLASTELVVPIRRVLVPAYATMLNDVARLKRAFVDGFGIIMLFGLPAATGLGVVADPLVRTALGEQWLGVIPLLQILVIYGVTCVAGGNYSPLLITLGHANIVAALAGLGAALLIPAFIWGCLNFGAVGGAWAVGITDSAILMIGLTYTLRVLDLGAAPLLKTTWRTVFATLVMALCVYITQRGLGEAGATPPLQLIASLMVGMISYTVMVVGLWVLCQRPDGAERMVLDYCRKRLAS